MENKNENNREIFEGYVLDLACIRKYPQDELLERAKAHTRDCALMGHCVESGYGLINENGEVRVLDAKATPLIVEKVSKSDKEKGIKLRAVREKNEQEMETKEIREI
jgi:hypothetical protein